MDIRFVETLLMAIEEGSLAAAARQQAITPAAASQRVAALEAQMRVPLLVRDGRYMSATPECEALLSDLRQMVILRSGLEGRLAEKRLVGPLRLGAISTALSDFGPALIQQLRRDAPEVELMLSPASSAEVFAQFEAGRLDAGVLVAPPFALPKTMRFDVLAQQPIGLLQKPGTPQSMPFLVYSRAAWGERCVGVHCLRMRQRHRCSVTWMLWKSSRKWWQMALDRQSCRGGAG
ncbi:hypothetical protein NBRC116594_11070 [Shimia sp. NS0008-38b]|uniref:LysR family transcriptional regulator n=1 Tax=Shimia sp. NS0008-38b TaxID=3127653 RepID=UPI00310362FD